MPESRYLSDWQLFMTEAVLRLAPSGVSPNLTTFPLADYCEWPEAAGLRDDGSGPHAVSPPARRPCGHCAIEPPLRYWYHTRPTGAADQP